MTAIAEQLERHDDIFRRRAEQARFGFVQSGFQAGHAGEDDAGRPDTNLETATGIPCHSSLDCVDSPAALLPLNQKEATSTDIATFETDTKASGEIPDIHRLFTHFARIVAYD